MRTGSDGAAGPAGDHGPAGPLPVHPVTRFQVNPLVLSYAIAPLALATLLGLRKYRLIADESPWLWVGVFATIPTGSALVDALYRRRPSPGWLHVRVAGQALSVTAVIYLTGWGPVLAGAFAFIALENIAHDGSRVWRITALWCLAGIAAGQLAVARHWLPSFLSVSRGEALALMGVVVLLFVIRMAAATMEQKEAAEILLAQQALHDPLTGLPNRQLIMDRAEQVLARAVRDDGPLAAFFIDLDNFKEVNDTLGHDAGDKLLQAVATRFLGVLRPSDTVGRLGGDEFVVLAEGDSLAGGPEPLARRLQAALAEPIRLDGYEGTALDVSASIGIAHGSRPSARELLRDADAALYQAKAAGKRRFVLFGTDSEPAAAS
jgi:diguanylate cyclase (GGDEF)-like protein